MTLSLLSYFILKCLYLINESKKTNNIILDSKWLLGMLLVVRDVTGRWLVSDLGLIIGRGLLINNLVARQINNLLLVVTNLVAIEHGWVPHTLSVRVVRGWRYNCWKVTHLLVTILLVAMVINILVAMVSGYWWLLVRIVHW